MKRIAIAVALTGVVLPASAGTWTFNDVLSWNQEVPPATGSQATGVAAGTYDDVTNVLSITTLSVSNLVGTFSASHIHQAPLGVNGPVIVNLPSFGSWSPTGPNMTWTQTSPIVLTAAQETAFLAGGTYINVHTNRFPGGEVRGQLYPVPEPATMAAMGLGLAVLAARKRRK